MCASLSFRNRIIMWQYKKCQLKTYDIDLEQRIVKCKHCNDLSPLDGIVESVLVSAPPVAWVAQGEYNYFVYKFTNSCLWVEYMDMGCVRSCQVSPAC